MKEKIYKFIFNEFLNLEWIRIRVSKILYRTLTRGTEFFGPSRPKKAGLRNTRS